jgi:hypothetical protein
MSIPDPVVADIRAHARKAAAKGRPAIMVRQELTAVTDEAVAAILDDPDLGVFARGRMLVTVGRDGSARERWLRRPPGAPVIVPIESARMLGILDAAADWRKFDARLKEDVPTRPPGWVAEQMLGRLEWPFRYLEGVIETPTLRPDGSILNAPGFDEDTGLLFEPVPGVVWPRIADRPTAADVRAAVAALLEPLDDFPFVAESDCAATIAAILTLIGRHLIDGPVPMFPIRAPTPATGKSLLAEVVGIIATGRTPPVATMAYDSDELRKRVTALAVGGTPLVLLDNVSGSMGSDALAAVLTATEWEDRILGATQMVRVPLRTVWLATGNNVGFKKTLGRRVVPIDLDAGLEVPEDRTGFRHPDLRAHVRRERPRLVAAALTILRGFHLAGRPVHGGARMGSFEAWDDLIRSAVVWTGLADPAGANDPNAGRGRIRSQSDDDADTLGALLEALAKLHPDAGPFTAAQVIRAAQENHDLRAALDAAAPGRRTGIATTSSLGTTLRELRGRPIGGLILHRIGRSWAVHRAHEACT